MRVMNGANSFISHKYFGENWAESLHAEKAQRPALKTPRIIPQQDTRFTTGEHIRLSRAILDKLMLPKIFVNGIEIPPGCIPAMADFIPGPETLENMKPEEIIEFVAALQREADNQTTSTPAVWNKLTNGQYALMTANKDPHFAPSNENASSDEKNNKNSYALFHNKALEYARASDMTKAYLYELFGWHYMDAFASGHSFNMMEVKRQFEEKLAHPAIKQKLVAALAKGIWANDGRKVKEAFTGYDFQGLLAFLMGTKKMDTPAAVERFVNAMMHYPKTSHIYSDLAVNMLHDYLGDIGLDVENGEARWHAYGDGKLDKSPESKRFIEKALLASFSQLMHANDGPASIDEVWKYVPKPTDSGLATIARESSRLMDPESEETTRFIAGQIRNNLDFVRSELLRDGYLTLASDVGSNIQQGMEKKSSGGNQPRL